jgi:hypothetical protein
LDRDRPAGLRYASGACLSDTRTPIPPRICERCVVEPKCVEHVEHGLQRLVGIDRPKE